MKAYLLLDDGTLFEGEALGAKVETFGELVFTTGMTGYQEAITDQSYNGQMITFTYPLIGNYGLNDEDNESHQPTCRAVIVREAARRASNWRAQLTLDEFLQRKGIPGIQGIDTRQLTKLIRSAGALKAVLFYQKKDLEDYYVSLTAWQPPTNQAAQSSTPSVLTYPGQGYHVVLVDYGMKESIIRELQQRDCRITVLPYNATAEEILALDPDGVMLSNGPGDPLNLPATASMIRMVQEHVPLFGICLGHQLFAIANGATTFKMPFGHRGFNHPVRDVRTGQVVFTSQNHGYAVEADSLETTPLEVTHIQINDQGIEGVRHRDLAAFSVQFHPDAAPGPHDAAKLFDQFIANMAHHRKG